MLSFTRSQENMKKDINEKTELLKLPPPAEPLTGADTSAKTMRKQVPAVLDNSEQYLIKVRKAIAELEQENITWDKTLSIPKCLTARPPKDTSKPEVSGGVAPTVITATVRIIREVSATAVKALPVRP